jgi:hypothetical protein
MSGARGVHTLVVAGADRKTLIILKNKFRSTSRSRKKITVERRITILARARQANERIKKVTAWQRQERKKKKEEQQ